MGDCELACPFQEFGDVGTCPLFSVGNGEWNFGTYSQASGKIQAIQLPWRGYSLERREYTWACIG